MKLFLSSLGGVGQSVIDNPFSHEATVRAIGGASDHYAFPSMAMAGSRIYAFYRDGTSHTVTDGVIIYQYSDDDGETWSSPVTYYTGSEVPALYPSDFPAGYAQDYRGPKVLNMSNGDVLINAPCSVFDSGGTLTARISTYIRVPVIGNTLDFANETKSYINDNGWFASQNHIEHDGVIYATGYARSTDPDGTVLLKRSTDYGATWSNVGTLSPISGETGTEANEATICMIGSKMIGSLRTVQPAGYATDWEDPVRPNILVESSNLGVTWSLKGFSNIRYDGQSSLYLGGGMVAFTGRISRADTDPVKFNSIVQVWDWENGVQKSLLVLDDDTYPLCVDRGYSKIMKYKNKYYVIYYNSTPDNPSVISLGDAGVYFRQLNYDSDTNTFSHGNN